MTDHKLCPECTNLIHYRAFKRHLVTKHGYRYTAESPNMPIKEIEA